MTIRERIEAMEESSLSPYAALSSRSRGRQVAESQDPVRTVYQRDRDRIIHLCKAFRRLAHKTQVFISPREDHLRTRLSHTLEVAQIGRTIAKALRLNEELTEAIALGHDVGHTPFGHSGEAALDEAYRRHDPAGGFAHNVHSLRVLDELERDGAGLNLTYETRMGVLGHRKSERDLAEVLAEGESTLEAMVIRVADRIAYLNHDLDDCLHARVLTQEELPTECMNVLGWRHSQRVGRMVTDVIEASLEQPRIAMGEEVLTATDTLKRFMFDHVYQRPELLAECAKVKGIIGGLFDVYMEDDRALFEAVGFVPEEVRRRARIVCDYIAGMTDRFARAQYVKHFLPSGYPF
ncbi:MAG: deoxyguanosinetriphosphate triphosphohydrolase [Armatimonadetes bacterium]|nr:deoxyguanosinetriphosphate triphosphohydrolase [Armatimonadota bacterium]